MSRPEEIGVEQLVESIVLWLRLSVESLGALIIGVGIIVAAYVFLRTLILRQPQSYNRIRLIFARFLSLALEFQLAADVLTTAVAPSWEQIGKLAAIAVIRTALNYFLSLEMREEQQDLSGDKVSPDNRRQDPMMTGPLARQREVATSSDFCQQRT